MPRTPRASVVIGTAALAAAALVAPAAAATAAPLSYPAVISQGITVNTPYPVYDIAVDCDAFTGAGENFYAPLVHVPGGSLTVTFDCELDDTSVDLLGDLPAGGTAQVTVDEGVTTVTIDPNTDFRAVFVGSPTAFEIDYVATEVLPDPAGTLLHDVTSTYGGGVAAFAVGDSPLENCVEDASDRPYITQVFTVVTEGSYTFRFTGYTPVEGGLLSADPPYNDSIPPNPWGTTNPWADPVLALYSAFDPSDTDAGFIACNDDSVAIDNFVAGFGARTTQDVFLDGYFSELTVTLTPGVYTLVSVPYDDADTQLVSAGKSGGLSSAYFIADLDDLGTITNDVQYWGQEGGILLGAQLAATGPSTTSGLLAGAAALLLLVGGALVIVRRRTA